MTIIEGMNQLDPESRRLVLRIMALFSIAALFVSLIPVVVIGLAWHAQADNRIQDNKEAIRRETEIRKATNAQHQAFTRVLEWQGFDGCVADEKRDAVIVSLLNLVPKKQRPAKVQQGIDALEPVVGDTVCIPPRGARPAGARP